MRLNFFKIPVTGGEAAEKELNAFLSSHKIVHCHKEFVPLGSESFLALCVSSVSSQKQESSSRIDYKEILNADEFSEFSSLRELRKELAEKGGVPVYSVFTNAQLAEVQRKIRSLSGLENIEGIGRKRGEKYGQQLLHFFETENK